MDYDGRRRTRLTPHEEEDDNFDWRDSLEDIEDPTYVITPDPMWGKEIRDDLRTKYNFTWNQKHGQWESFGEFSQDKIDEMLERGIEVEKYN